MFIAMPLRIFAAMLWLSLPLSAQVGQRKSLLDSDPSVVYLEQTLKKPLELKLQQIAPIFSDKDGRNRSGTLQANQTVQLEALSDKSYRVRGLGMPHRIVGWVSPKVFADTMPAELSENLKKHYDREIQVRKYIAEKKVAIGMTMDEVAKVKGKPTKTSLRQTAEGQSGRWEFIDYKDVKNYATEIDRYTGRAYRRLVNVTREEKGKTAIDFENGHVTALEESEEQRGSNVRIIVPPITLRW